MDRHWIGGSGNWDDTAHWSDTKSGTGGFSVPTSGDNAFLDDGSGTGTVTINVTVDCLDFDCTGYTGTLYANFKTLNIYGSLKFVPGMTNNYSGVIHFKATATGKTCTLAGWTSSGGDVYFEGSGGGWTLQDALTISGANLGHRDGHLNTNGQTVTCYYFNEDRSNARTLTLGNSTINCSYWDYSGSSLTLNENTSTINCDTDFNGGGETYYNVVLTGTTPGLLGANTYTNFTWTAPASRTAALILSDNQTVSGVCTLSGYSNSTRAITKSSVAGTAITITAATFAGQYMDFIDITCAGAGTPFAGTALADGGGNTQITFASPVVRHWVGGTGNYDDTGHWSTSKGGSSGASMPTIQDEAIFDDSSFSGGSQTVTLRSPRLGKTTWTDATNSPTFTWSNSVEIYGSQVYIDDMTLSATSRSMTWRNRSDCTYRPANETNSPNYLNIQCIGAKVTLLGPLDMSGASQGQITHTSGGFDANDFNVAIKTYDGYSSATRTLTMGDGTWSISGTGNCWYMYVSTGLTLEAEGSTLKFINTTNTALTFTASGSGGGKTYNNIWFARGASTANNTIAGTFTCNDFKDDGSEAHTIIWTKNINYTVTTFTVSGHSSKLISMTTDTAGTPAHLLCSSGVISCDYLSIKDIHAEGGASWYAGSNSTNVSGNNGWIFTGPPVPVSIQTDLEYDVAIVTPVSIQKTLGYAVKPEVSLTSALQYMVIANYSETKAIEYDVLTEEALTNPLEYRIKTVSDLHADLEYDVVVPEEITKGLKYCVAAAQQTALDMSYRVDATNWATKAIGYAVIKSNKVTKAIAYRVKAELPIAKSLQYCIFIPKRKTKALEYIVRVYPYSRKTSPYSRFKKAL